ncbi:MAG TPA: amidohydrolase family protein [Thermoleophilaceae bacterium]|nr:amidohydrolase family protein [Thermoleophilaceae bacterium]
MTVCAVMNGLAGARPIIDTHIHQWDPFTTPREVSRLAPVYRRAPRLFERLFPLLAGKANRETLLTPRHALRPYLPADYLRDVAALPATFGLQVEAVIHVEADWHSDDPVEETRWVDGLPFGRDGAPRLAAVIGHADPRQRGFAEVLDRHAAASGRFRGIRCMAAWHPDPKVRNWSAGERILRSPEFLRGFAALAERGLTFDAYVFSRQLPDVVVLAREYPDTTIVLDHYAPLVGWLGPMGKATGRTDSERADLLARWRDDIGALAEHPNVVAKHSGLAFPPLGFGQPGIDRAALAGKIRPLVDHVTDAFGEDRVLFGSNFPMDKAVTSYEVIAGALVDTLAPRGDRLLAKVFRENAERVYRTEP